MQVAIDQQQMCLIDSVRAVRERSSRASQFARTILRLPPFAHCEGGPVPGQAGLLT